MELRKFARSTICGLLGGVFNDGQTLRLDCGEDNIDCRADGRLVEVDGAALKSLRGGVNNGVLADSDGRAEKLKALYMTVDRTHSEVAAAGHGDFRTVESAEQRADKIVRGAQMLRHIVRHDVGVDPSRIYLERALAQTLYLRPELFENFCHIINITDVGNVFDSANVLSKNSCGQNSHEPHFWRRLC